VITSNAAPMNEIGGPAARYIPLLKHTDDVGSWALNSVATLKSILALPEAQRACLVEQGLAHAAKFNAEDAIEGYLKIYQRVQSHSITEQNFNKKSLIARKKVS